MKKSIFLGTLTNHSHRNKSIMFRLLVFVLTTLFLPQILPAQNWQSPQPVSGKKVLNDWLALSLQYEGVNNGSDIREKVTLGLVVDQDGNTLNYKVLRGSNQKLNNEALRIAKKILWKPAVRNGKAVSAETTIDIVFNSKQHLRRRSMMPQFSDAIQQIPQDQSNKIYTFAQVEELPKPMLPINFSNISHYIAGNLKYPEAAVAGGLEGLVSVGFIIETDGYASNLVIGKSLGGGCDQEAIRILQTMRWIPAMLNDTFVRTQTQIEVAFKLKEQRQSQIPNRQSGIL